MSTEFVKNNYKEIIEVNRAEGEVASPTKDQPIDVKRSVTVIATVKYNNRVMHVQELKIPEVIMIWGERNREEAESQFRFIDYIARNEFAVDKKKREELKQENEKLQKDLSDLMKKMNIEEDRPRVKKAKPGKEDSSAESVPLAVQEESVPSGGSHPVDAKKLKKKKRKTKTKAKKKSPVDDLTKSIVDHWKEAEEGTTPRQPEHFANHIGNQFRKVKPKLKESEKMNILEQLKLELDDAWPLEKDLLVVLFRINKFA
jgi:hypothetical protein